MHKLNPWMALTNAHDSWKTCFNILLHTYRCSSKRTRLPSPGSFLPVVPFGHLQLPAGCQGSTTAWFVPKHYRAESLYNLSAARTVLECCWNYACCVLKNLKFHMFSLEYHCTAYHCPENQHLCNQKRWPCLAHDPCLSFGSIELGRLQSSHKVLCQNRWHQCVCQKRIIKYARLCQYSHSRGQPKPSRHFQTTKSYWSTLNWENLWRLGPLTPASTACAEGSDGKATSRPPEVSAEKPLLSW